MKTTSPWDAVARPSSPPPAIDMAALFGEWAALVRRPGEDSERLELAIRVVEALQQDLGASQSPQ